MKNIIVGFGMLLLATCIFLYTAGVYDFGFIQDAFRIQKIDIKNNRSLSSTQDEVIAREAVEKKYTQFKNFEKQKTVFGRKIDVLIDGGNRYLAYINYADDVHVGTAWCFQVDIVGTVTQTGTFPPTNETYSNFMNVYPKTCEGLR